MHGFIRSAAAVAASAFLLLGCEQLPQDFDDPMDYRDADEGRAVLMNHHQHGARHVVYDIGPTRDVDFRQFAVKIGLDPETEDDGTRNAVVFVCGIHGNEWYAAESCLWLALWLINQYERADVQELLQHADVWIIPYANPAGRMFDDMAMGDPSMFRYWRGNTNIANCSNGVDLNRNWSVKWFETSLERCANRNHPGFRAMSELENLNLRRFINNHMISMAVDVHTSRQDLSALWDGGTPGGRSDANVFMRDRALEINYDAWAANDPPPPPPAFSLRPPTLERAFIGDATGHITAWLAGTSPCDTDPDIENAPCGRPDQKTRREISTFILELPFDDVIYSARGYQGVEFRHPGYPDEPKYPSSKIVERLWRDTLRPVFLYFVRQARSPQCPTDATGSRVTAQCKTFDISIVGAKIGRDPALPGELSYDAATTMETLPAGDHWITAVVQNSGLTDPFGQVTVQAALSSQNADGTNSANVSAPSTVVTVAPGERAVVSLPFTVEEGTVYVLSVNVAVSDDFPRDNAKVFRFLAVAP